MSSSDYAIRIKDIGKQYRLNAGHSTGGMFKYKSLGQSLSDFAKNPLKVLKPKGPLNESNSFWALKDVSFDVKKGEVVGIIGRNGAGKSTLLKILSRITRPTTGEIELRGRVGSLLEVGTGFHPELSGRENIYLNGAILGMTRGEVKRKFDEIVAFSEIEKFLDTPVKRYSSGMYTRLAFAVAAHLDPEILVVDEVLAVGDAEFQKRCFGKMSEVAKAGRTVLLVSHNAVAVSRLCESGLLLETGRVNASGPVDSVLKVYLGSGQGNIGERCWNHVQPGNEVARLVKFRACNEFGDTISSIATNESVGIEMVFDVHQGGYVLVPNYHVYSGDGSCLFVAQEIQSVWWKKVRPPGRHRAVAWIPANLLSEGTIFVGAALTTFSPMTVHFYERDAISVQVVEAKSGISARGDFHGHIPGAVRPLLVWTSTYEPHPS